MGPVAMSLLGETKPAPPTVGAAAKSPAKGRGPGEGDFQALLAGVLKAAAPIRDKKLAVDISHHLPPIHLHLSDPKKPTGATPTAFVIHPLLAEGHKPSVALKGTSTPVKIGKGTLPLRSLHPKPGAGIHPLTASRVTPSPGSAQAVHPMTTASQLPLPTELPATGRKTAPPVQGPSPSRIPLPTVFAQAVFAQAHPAASPPPVTRPHALPAPTVSGKSALPPVSWAPGPSGHHRQESRTDVSSGHGATATTLLRGGANPVHPAIRPTPAKAPTPVVDRIHGAQGNRPPATPPSTPAAPASALASGQTVSVTGGHVGTVSATVHSQVLEAVRPVVPQLPPEGRIAIRVALTPPDLGHVSVTLTASPMGLSVTMEAASPLARLLLKDGAPELRRRLEGMGMTGGSVQVKVSQESETTPISDSTSKRRR